MLCALVLYPLMFCGGKVGAKRGKRRQYRNSLFTRIVVDKFCEKPLTSVSSRDSWTKVLSRPAERRTDATCIKSCYVTTKIMTAVSNKSSFLLSAAPVGSQIGNKYPWNKQITNKINECSIPTLPVSFVRHSTASLKFPLPMLLCTATLILYEVNECSELIFTLGELWHTSATMESSSADDWSAESFFTT